MKEYTFNVAHDFSCNIIGECVPKNALFGKTLNYYWVFSDYEDLFKPVCFIRIGTKTHGWKTCVMRTDTQLGHVLRKVALANFAGQEIKVERVLQMRNLKKPVRRDPQRTYTPMKNTAYELRKQNGDNSVWCTNVLPNMDEPPKDHVKHPFSEYRPENKKYDAPVKVDRNKWESEPDAKRMAKAVKDNQLKRWLICKN